MKGAGGYDDDLSHSFRPYSCDAADFRESPSRTSSESADGSA